MMRSAARDSSVADRAHTVLLFVSGPHRDRYPVGTVVAADGTYLTYQEVDRAQPVALPAVAVVDDVDDAPLQELDYRVPLVVSSADIARLAGTARDLAPLAGRQWVPFAPLACSADVVAASDWVRQGRIGTPQVLQVTATVASSPAVWATDHPQGADLFEALVFGMQLTELLLGEEVAASTRLGGQDLSQVFQHQTTSDVLVLTRVCDAAHSRTPGFSAELYGSSGRLLLRPEFAPGALGLHTDDGLEFPAVRPAKSNIQSPDTVQGGWDGVEVVRTAMQDLTKAEFLRKQMERLIDMVWPLTTSDGGMR